MRFLRGRADRSAGGRSFGRLTESFVCEGDRSFGGRPLISGIMASSSEKAAAMAAPSASETEGLSELRAFLGGGGGGGPGDGPGDEVVNDEASEVHCRGQKFG